MKRNIRKIGLIIVLGLSITSCTKEVEVLEPNLSGVYKYKSVFVPVPMDLDKDGTYNSNLILEKGKECVWDNTWQYQNEKVILREGEKYCGEESQESNENGVIGSFNYVYDKASKTIKIIYEGGYSETLKNVKIGYTSDEKQTLSYELWDDNYQQEVTYYLESF